jgi:hypothetical protein
MTRERGFHSVIPGRIANANDDVQLHIGESRSYYFSPSSLNSGSGALRRPGATS